MKKTKTISKAKSKKKDAKKTTKRGLGFIPSTYNGKKSKAKQSDTVKLAQDVVARAVELTQEELKPVAKKVTKITYPKGAYKETYSKNYKKARKELGLEKAKPKAKKKK